MTPKEKELDWKEYEAITQYIYGALGQQQGIKVIGYGHTCKVEGKSGVSYQIDVLTEQSVGEKKHRTAIECKYITEKVTNDTVMKLYCIMEDAGIESGIIVCRSGFTKDTLIYAEHKGIKLVELREAQEDDKDYNKTLEIGTLDLRMNIIRSRGEVTKIDLGKKVITDEREIMGMWYARLHDAKGDHISFGKFMGAFSAEAQIRGELMKTITIEYPLNFKLYWNDITIEKVAISGFYSKTDLSQTKSFRMTDQVWLIMKDLFENKNFTMSKSGGIWDLDKQA
jgi:hypothetical protein